MRAGTDEHRRLIEVAQGEREADLFVRGGTIANVYSGELLRGNVAVSGGRVAYVGEGERNLGCRTELIEADGMIVAPGYIEAHSHPWALYNPVSLAQAVLPLGATTLVADNLFFYMQMGPERFEALLDDLHEMPLEYLWVARLISQARFPGEAEMFALERIRTLLVRDDVVGTAEITRWPDLAAADSALLAGIGAAGEARKVSDGHTGGASEARLPALVAAGIDADHEAITEREVLGRLRLGLWTMMRYSSLRPDLPRLLRAVTEEGVSTHRLIMTTDGSSPEHIAGHGFVDGMLRLAVEQGVPPVQALQMVTLNPATWLRLDNKLGGIAPGRRADILVLPDLETFRPEVVISRGRLVARGGRLLHSLPRLDWDRYGSRPAFRPGVPLHRGDFYLPRSSGTEAEMPVIHLESAVITTPRSGRFPVENGRVLLDGTPGILYAALVDREGRWVSRALLSGFAGRLQGFASTYNTTTQLLVIGRHSGAMAQAASRVRDLGGGIVLVENGRVVYELPLPISGMMSPEPFGEVVLRNRRLSEEIGARGYPFHDILYTLLFLTCDFLPAIRLTPLGILEVKTGKVILPAAPISD